MHRISVLAALLLTAVLAPPAAAQAPVFTTTPMFFTCEDPTPVHNGAGPMGLSTVRPTGSFTAGEGCGFVDQDVLVSTAGPGNDLVDAVFEGTFTGPVRDLTVELHDLLLTGSEATLNGTVGVDVRLEVDDRLVVDTTPGTPVEIEAVPSATGLTQSVRFSIDLREPALTEDVERRFRLTIGKGWFDTAAAWVAGASEVPAGITFNPPSLQAVRLRAN